ncbi:MAG: cysteine protease StiP family protein [Pseudomonadota bacterium]
MSETGFCGSYRSDDVCFLLKRLALESFTAFASVADKEEMIQRGKRHYSEMLSPESLPSERYLAVFRDAVRTNLAQMAGDCLALAALIHARRSESVTLVSLARAGTPVGVILKHVLARVFKRDSAHYSVSIIRDRGIDAVALRHLLAQGHSAESIVFIDGWTGKGVISRELAHTVARFNAEHGVNIDSGLYVLSDLAGSAACAASCADYLIPSSILNATVSGLVSRSILNEQIGAGDFHGCVYYAQFEPHDQSRQFADEVVEAAVALAAADGVPAAQAVDRASALAVSTAFMLGAMERYGISDANLIKPGIGEATRVLLRRVPRLLILRDPDAPDVAHLKVLAAEKNVPIAVEADLPYQAVSLIRTANDA